MKNFIQARVKNYGFWVSLFALISLVAQTFGVNIIPDNYNEITNSILTILVMLGVVNNPTTDNKGYGDDN